MTRPDPKRNPIRVFALAVPIVLLLAIALATIAPASASSEPAKPPPPPGAFSLQASNGYSILVVGIPAQLGEPAIVVVFVSGRNGSATYLAPAAVTETSLEADLGALGEIAVTFQPSGQSRTEPFKCSDDPATVAAGHYEGTIAFHGEEGFTNVEATRAPGNLGFFASHCMSSFGMSSGPGLPGARLEAEVQRARDDIRFSITKNHPRARAHYEVGVRETRDEILISRVVSGLAPPGAFRYDPLVRSATVQPPAPFSGTARFHRLAKPANRWTGNLAVDLPGRSNMRLTRGAMKTSLVHGRWDWG